MSEQNTCHYCGPTDSELRPYGPGGSDVCFPCATATPEREKAAQNSFGGLLDAVEVISPGPVMIGTPDGPVPFDPSVLTTPPTTDRPADGDLGEGEEGDG